MKKLICFSLITIMCVMIINANSQTHTGSMTIGTPAASKNNQQQTKIDISREMLRFTPVNGMLPYFEENLYSSHKEANDLLKIVGAEPMPEFYPGHNYELPALKTDMQKNLQARVDNYLELTMIKYELQSQVEGRAPEDIIKAVPSEENIKRSREITQRLRTIDTHIFNDIKNSTPEATRDIVDFVIKRGNRGNISALSHVMTNLKETLNHSASGNIDHDSSSGRMSPGGSLGSFLSGGGLEKVTSFIDNVISIVGQVSNLLGIGQEFAGSLQQTLGLGKELITKFHEIFCMINTMFSGSGEGQTASLGGTASMGAGSSTASFTSDSSGGAQPADSGTTTPALSGQPATPGTAFSGNLSRDIRFERLIENGEFIDVTTMNSEAIQQFFVSNNSRLKDNYRGQLPAQIIYDVCAQYGINPKVILATAQKEQSLVTKSNVTAETLDWAMGVGCPDSGYKNPAYRGLGKQLESSIKIFKRWYDDGISKNISSTGTTKRVNYGTANQRIENEATYSLYMYTPHTVDIRLNQRGGGNYLFCQVYIRFFGGFLR